MEVFISSIVHKK
ncbi:hypothetical protein F383_10784 [Gossypium arboreum]|uniref:Uncharacterized protein n=1 Tax=Gossypium arboreum TaxID=29729 RepID=A0A0B0N880_GOSAR|nr:hypothetical protein F383_10784 [Gossypium arboreum]